jgi:hypothetical protein
MGDSESEKLCARLTESVGDRPVDVFYKEFNVERPTVFAEFYFKEMMQIYHLPGMELWPKFLSAHGSGTKQEQGIHPPKFYLSLVCFWPPSKTSSSPAQMKKRVKLAHQKACDMVSSCFESNEDHKCIKVAMDNYPTIAIFFCQVVNHQKELQRKCSNNKNLVCRALTSLSP